MSFRFVSKNWNPTDCLVGGSHNVSADPGSISGSRKAVTAQSQLDGDGKHREDKKCSWIYVKPRQKPVKPERCCLNSDTKLDHPTQDKKNPIQNDEIGNLGPSPERILKVTVFDIISRKKL